MLEKRLSQHTTNSIQEYDTAFSCRLSFSTDNTVRIFPIKPKFLENEWQYSFVKCRVVSEVFFVLFTCDKKTTNTTMSEINIDISKLPEDVREKLAELDLELSEGKLKIFKNWSIGIWFFLVQLSCLLLTSMNRGYSYYGPRHFLYFNWLINFYVHVNIPKTLIVRRTFRYKTTIEKIM